MSSPLKFLDAFERGDKAIFFGRSAEVEALYRLVGEANLVLVYGVSGTGKTSLIQCGLANRFAETDWFQLFVRRTDDINLSLDREIRLQAETPIPEGVEPVEAIRSLYLDHLRPVYLIFDQFEELFILGSREEQDRFFGTVAAIIASDVSCKIIISLREEYLASLHRLEEVVPTLFNKRLRVEPMSMRSVEEVITGTTAALGIGLEHGAETARLIIDQLEDERAGVQLAYLQVYLDSLYDQAEAEGEPILFTDAAIRRTGKLGDVMVQFLAEQTGAIQRALSADHPGLLDNAVAHLLEEFVTVDGTKQPTRREELVDRLPSSAPWIDDALTRLQAARILRNVDGRYEISHDTLAARINDQRSGERLAVLAAQKLVRDRVALLPLQKKKRYLSAEDLLEVNRSLRQIDPIRGTPLLELTAEERRFVDKSISRLRWKRGRFVGAIVGATTLLLAFFAIIGLQQLDLDDAAVAATNETDWLAYRAYFILLDRKEPEIVSLRSDLLSAQADLNTAREAFLGPAEDGDFWHRLLDADLDRENGNPERGRAAHLQLEREYRARLKDDPEDLRARVRLKAILWRLYTSEEDEEGWKTRAKQVLDVIAGQGEGRVDFANDIRDACDALNQLNGEHAACKGQQFAPPAEAAPVEAAAATS